MREPSWPPVEPPADALALYRALADVSAPDGWWFPGPEPDRPELRAQLEAGHPLASAWPPAVRADAFVTLLRQMAAAASRLPGDAGQAPRAHLDGVDAELARLTPEAVGRWILDGDWEADVYEGFLLEHARRAYLRAYARKLVERLPELETGTLWTQPTCPVCGGLPGLGQVAKGLAGTPGPRLLVCRDCSTRWRCPRFTCPFCAGDEATEVVTVEDDDHAELQVCKGCHRYLKVICRETTEDAALLDIQTLYLDLLAEQLGFVAGGDLAGAAPRHRCRPDAAAGAKAAPRRAE